MAVISWLCILRWLTRADTGSDEMLESFQLATLDQGARDKLFSSDAIDLACTCFGCMCAVLNALEVPDITEGTLKTWVVAELPSGGPAGNATDQGMT